MVHTDTHSRMMLPAGLQEGYQPRLYLLQLGSILLVGIFQVLELACGIDIVSGIDANLLALEGSHLGHTGMEVYVGNKGHHAPRLAHPGIDEAHILCFAHALGRQPNVFATGFSDAQYLADACFGVHRHRVGHTLYPDRLVPAHRGIAHLDDVGGSASVVE